MARWHQADTDKRVGDAEAWVWAIEPGATCADQAQPVALEALARSRRVGELAEALRGLEVGRMVREAASELPVEELEAVAEAVAAKHLGAIRVLGYGLGLLAGVALWAVSRGEREDGRTCATRILPEQGLQQARRAGPGGHGRVGDRSCPDMDRWQGDEASYGCPMTLEVHMVRSLALFFALVASTAAHAASKDDCDSLSDRPIAKAWCYAYYRDTSGCDAHSPRNPYEPWCKAYATKGSSSCTSKSALPLDAQRTACTQLSMRERGDDDGKMLDSIEAGDPEGGDSTVAFIQAIAKYNAGRCNSVRDSKMNHVCDEALVGLTVAREGAAETAAPSTLSSVSREMVEREAALELGRSRVSAWTLDKAVRDATVREMFRSYLEEGLAGEQLDFWLDARGTLSGEACPNLVTKYGLDQAKPTGGINFSGEVRTSIEKFMLVPYVTCETTAGEIGIAAASSDASGGLLALLGKAGLSGDATLADQIGSAAGAVKSALAGRFNEFCRDEDFLVYLGQ